MDKVRIAVVGIGNIGNLHLRNIETQPKSATEFLNTSQESFARPGTDVETFTFDNHGGQHVEVLENFADAILSGAELTAPAEEGIHSVELANAMLYSSLVGGPVDLQLDSAAYEQKLKELIANSTFTKESSERTESDMSKSFG